MPKHAKMFMKENKNMKLKSRGAGANSGSSSLSGGGDGKMNGTAGVANELALRPGNESYRRNREDLTTMDKLHMALTELCFAINHSPSVHVWDYTFSPREYLAQNLENRFNKSLFNMTMYNDQSKEIAKPSELLVSVRAYMHVLQSIESHGNALSRRVSTLSNVCILCQFIST